MTASAVSSIKGRSRVRLPLPPPGTGPLVLSNLIYTVGTGMFLTGGTVFFLRSASLTVADLALGLTVAGLVGLLLSVPIGALADRCGAREVAVGTLWVQALATAAFVLVSSRWSLVLAASVALTAERGGAAAFGALTAYVGGANRVHLRAYQRAVTNVGVSVGAGIGGLLVAVGSREAFLGLMTGTAAALALAGAVALRASRVPPVPAPDGAAPLPPLRDPPYVAVTALNGVLSLSYDIVSFGLPAWIVTRTAAPAWLITVLILLNTALVVFFQVPVSRGVRTARHAAIVGRRSGPVLLAACALVAVAPSRSPVLGAAVLLAAVAILTLGELLHATASFTLSFELAQEHAHGQYQAVFALGEGVERALAPLILGALCFGWGSTGWLVLGALFVGSGALLPPVVRAAERRAARGLRP
jgi:MFS transporter